MEPWAVPDISQQSTKLQVFTKTLFDLKIKRNTAIQCRASSTTVLTIMPYNNGKNTPKAGLPSG